MATGIVALILLGGSSSGQASPSVLGVATCEGDVSGTVTGSTLQGGVGKGGTPVDPDEYRSRGPAPARVSIFRLVGAHLRGVARFRVGNEGTFLRRLPPGSYVASGSMIRTPTPRSRKPPAWGVHFDGAARFAMVQDFCASVRIVMVGYIP